MNAVKFAVAALVLLGLYGCELLPRDKSSPIEEQVTEEVKKIRVMLAKNTEAYQWFVEDVIDYHDTSMMKEIRAEADKRGGKINLTRLPKLLNPPPTTVAIANLVMKNFKNNLTENGLKVVNVPCDSCLRVKIEFALYEREVVKFILFVPVWQSAMAVIARAKIFYQGKLVFETSGAWEMQQFKGLLESKASQEERAAAATAQQVAKEIAGLIAETRQQLIAAQ